MAVNAGGDRRWPIADTARWRFRVLQELSMTRPINYTAFVSCSGKAGIGEAGIDDTN